MTKTAAVDPRYEIVARNVFKEHFGDPKYPHATVEEQLAEVLKNGLTEEALISTAIVDGKSGALFLRYPPQKFSQGKPVFIVSRVPPYSTKEQTLALIKKQMGRIR